MKFVKETVDTLPKEEIDALLNEVSNDNNEIETINAAAKELQDKLGIEETKQPVEEKPVAKTIKVTKEEEWLDATVKTLVNLRKQSNKIAEVLTTVKGGDIIKISSSFSHPEFEKVQYKGKEGYIVKEYVRKI